MISLQKYLNESINNSETIQTKEIVDILKKGGETTQEIKKDINTNQNTISYLTCVKIFCNKCIEWAKTFIKMHERNMEVEGKNYLKRNLGEDWAEFLINSFDNFYASILELNKVVNNNDIKEDWRDNWDIHITNIDNYREFHDHLIILKRLDNELLKFEENNDMSKFKDILKLRLEISKNIQKNLFKSAGRLKDLIETIWNYKREPIHLLKD